MNKNAVVVLNEWLPGIAYQLVSQRGAAHNPTFTVAVDVNGQQFRGEGRSKKAARLAAAQQALSAIPQAQQGKIAKSEKKQNHENALLQKESVVPLDRDRDKNPVSALSELFPQLSYHLEERKGSTGNARFAMSVDVNGQQFCGEGRSKKLAKFAAAQHALFTITRSFHSSTAQNSRKRGHNSDSETSAVPEKSQALSVDFARISPENCLALDCENVEIAGAGQNGFASALGRISIVGFNGNTVLDVFSRPSQPVTDYRTWISGIRKRDIDKAEPFHVVQQHVLNTVRGKILIGHSIDNDLKVLEIEHPKADIRDTRLHPWLMAQAGYHSMGLKRLTKLLLNICAPSVHHFHVVDWEIQKKDHSSLVDAIATMELFKMAERATGRLDSDETGYKLDNT